MYRIIPLILMTWIMAGCTGNSSEQEKKSETYDFPWYNPDLSFEERLDLLVNEMTIEEKISQLTFDAAAIDRLGVPDYNWWSEALHGVARTGRATVFPQPIGLAATFDRDLIHQI